MDLHYLPSIDFEFIVQLKIGFFIFLLLTFHFFDERRNYTVSKSVVFGLFDRASRSVSLVSREKAVQ